VATAGDGPGEGIGAPLILAVGGPDLLIVDVRGNLWRWRPSDDQGRGTLGPVRLGGDVAWGNDIVDVGTYVVDPEQGLYNLYVADPSSRQILRYPPLADGSGFSTPSGFLAAETDEVADYRGLYIDGDLYALSEEGVAKFVGGSVREFELDIPPDDGDIRPGHRYHLVAAFGPRNQGEIYIWDAQHARIIVFAKSDGSYLRQFVLRGANAGSLRDVRGLYLSEAADSGPPTLFWATVGGVWSSVLDAAEPQETPGPETSPGPVGSPARSELPAAGVGP
jgi:hypothetical protein